MRIAYTAGFGLAFIGTFFIPFTQLVKIANLQKLTKLQQQLFKSMKTVVNNTATHIGNKSKQAYQNSIKLFEQMLRVFAKGKESIKKFLDDIWEQIAKWFVKNKKAFQLVDKVDDILLPFIRVLKDNVNYLKALNLVKTAIKENGHGRHLGKWLAVESEAMIKLYTSFQYKALNEALNKGKRLNKELKAMQKVLDDALSRLPISKYNKTHTLLRSAYFTEKEIRKTFRIGKDFINKGFFSTTHSPKSLLNWMRQKPNHNVIFKVKGKNGKLIEKAAYKLNEHEILFKSGTPFVVESIEPYFDMKIMREITEIILKEK